jgi:hypothetical protein
MNDIATSNIARAANKNGGGKPDFPYRTIEARRRGKRVLSASISTCPCRMAVTDTTRITRALPTISSS